MIVPNQRGIELFEMKGNDATIVITRNQVVREVSVGHIEVYSFPSERMI